MRAHPVATLALVGFLGFGAYTALENTLYPGQASAVPSTLSLQNPSFSGKRVRPVDLDVNTPYHMSGPQWATGFHTGIDYPAPSGTPVRAAAAGTVVKAGWNVDGSSYGIAIVIKHNGKTYTQYAHLGRSLVRAGDKVDVGQKIAYSGGTGMKSTGPHLHFEVRTGPNYLDDINPTTWLNAG